MANEEDKAAADTCINAASAIGIGALAAIGGAMYAMLGMGILARPKRLFMDEPPEGETELDVESTAAQRENGREVLELWLEVYRQAGAKDYNENRANLAKVGVRTPKNVQVPKDDVNRLLFYSWSNGWYWAQRLDALGLPQDTFGTKTYGNVVNDAVFDLALQSKDAKEAVAKFDAILFATADAKSGVMTDADALAKIREILGALPVASNAHTRTGYAYRYAQGVHASAKQAVPADLSPTDKDEWVRGWQVADQDRAAGRPSRIPVPRLPLPPPAAPVAVPEPPAPAAESPVPEKPPEPPVVEPPAPTSPRIVKAKVKAAEAPPEAPAVVLANKAPPAEKPAPWLLLRVHRDDGGFRIESEGSDATLPGNGVDALTCALKLHLRLRLGPDEDEWETR